MTQVKKITFIELDVNFPETQSTGPEMSYRINLGQIPSIGYTSKESLSVPAGDELSVIIDEKRYEDLLKLISERHSISDIRKARVQVGFVVFDDGTAWSVAGYLRQDPNNPKRWVRIDN